MRDNSYVLMNLELFGIKEHNNDTKLGNLMKL